LYVLSSDKVTVMSETGGIVRRLRFRKSDPETTAVRLNVSDGLLSIVLAKTGKDQVQIRKYLVMYAVTGEKFGYYEPSEELGNTDVCCSRTDGHVRSVQPRPGIATKNKSDVPTLGTSLLC